MRGKNSANRLFKKIGHLSLFIFVIILNFTSHDLALAKSIRSVSIDDYSSIDKCWEMDGRFIAFIVIRDFQKDLYAYMVSPVCKVPDFDGGVGETMAFYIAGLHVAGDGGRLKSRGLLRRELTPAISEHSPKPRETDRVYIFKGLVQVDIKNSYKSIVITDVDQFKDTKVAFRRFTLMGAEKRFKLFFKLLH